MKMLPEPLEQMERLRGPAAATPHVVHVVGRVTESVFGFLGPATTALARRGFDQTLILLDDQRHDDLRALLERSIELLPVSAAGGPMSRWMRVLAAYRGVLRDGLVSAVHLHGAIPYFVCSAVRAPMGAQPAVLFSPHGSKVLTSLPWRSGGLVRLVSLLLARGRHQRMIGARHEARWLSRISRKSVSVLECPVDSDWFELIRHESAHPLVAATGGFDDTFGAAVTARLAVLFSDDESGIRFEWFGPLDGSREQLAAAGIGVIGKLARDERVHRLSSAWVYLAAGVDRAFPHRLAEAMALGIPCVAIDCTASRDLLRHGESGFLYRTAEAAMFHVAKLLDSPELRERVGAAARLDARSRFRAERFDSGLFDLYRLDAIGDRGVSTS